ncbi:MAG: hypothetical protein A3I91_05065 [Candidatus Kerfeldbacteria bacterium RIFCSPLOWO2_02_FULL_42_19]|nr:MAG: hypothetical protein A3I91_05065 [Candidatus Kerfeldbacteria bacterium RIFCSPLOWO2_02_FULL_42_19]
MAKAKLATLTEKWIDGKTEKQLAVKTERQNTAENDQKIKQTLYMSRKAAKLLGHNRAETGEPMSHTVEQLILNHIGKK